MTTEATAIPELPVTSETITELPVPSEEQIAKNIEVLGHSVDLINAIVDAGNKTDNDIQSVTANYQHLEIMLAKDYIKPTNANLTNINAAITAAKSFLA